MIRNVGRTVEVWKEKFGLILAGVDVIQRPATTVEWESKVIVEAPALPPSGFPSNNAPRCIVSPAGIVEAWF